LAKKAFEKLLLEAIDDALSTLGDSARQSIYFHLERKLRIPRSDIPQRLQVFEDGLFKIFGPGSQFLEVLIMKKLHEKIGRPLRWDESRPLVFVDT
jgi:hypothetical protein